MTTIKSKLAELKDLLTQSLRNPEKRPTDNISESSTVGQNVHNTVRHTPGAIPNLRNPRAHLHDFDHCEPFFPHDNRPECPNYDQNKDHADGITRKVKIDAPEFDGCLDPKAFLN